MNENFHHSTSLLTFGIVNMGNFIDFRSRIVKSHCLISISLVTNDVELFLISLFAICTSSLETGLSRYLPICELFVPFFIVDF